MPHACTIGWAKISDKIGVLDNILGKVDVLLIGGGMAATFLKSMGHEVGKSAVEMDKLDLAQKLVEKAKARGVKFLMPVDVVVADKVASGAKSKTVSIDKVPADWFIMDIGHKTIELFKLVHSFSLIHDDIEDGDEERRQLPMVQRFECFSRKLGMAYQMIADVLGIWGDEPFSDIRKKKKTLPIIYALEHASDRDRSKLLEIYGRESINRAGVRQVIDILNRLKTEEYSRRIAQECYTEALAELGKARLSASTLKELTEVTDFLMDREY